MHPAVWRRELGPHLTQSRLGRGLAAYQACDILIHAAIWSATDMGRKLGGCAPLGERELGPYLTQCGQGRSLPACQVSS